MVSYPNLIAGQKPRESDNGAVGYCLSCFDDFLFFLSCASLELTKLRDAASFGSNRLEQLQLGYIHVLDLTSKVWMEELIKHTKDEDIRLLAVSTWLEQI